MVSERNSMLKSDYSCSLESFGKVDKKAPNSLFFALRLADASRDKRLSGNGLLSLAAVGQRAIDDDSRHTANTVLIQSFLILLSNVYQVTIA